MYVSQRLLHLRSKKHIYNIWTLDKQVPEDEEDGRITLNSPYTDHSVNNVALLDTELPTKRARKKTACCMCCSLE